ncbi:MAG: hypothetical protein ACOC0P_01975 [Planctomycetota bacterium]
MMQYASQTEGVETAPDVLYRFDRRCEARSVVRGEAWAQVMMCDPFRTPLGGAMRIIDISPHGLSLECHHAVPIDETVEVRLAPFRIRGRIGRIVRCDRMEPQSRALRTGTHGSGERFRIVIAFSRATFAA